MITNNVEYKKLVQKIETTCIIIERLEVIENEVNELVDDGRLEYKVKELISDCINSINKIYINNNGTQESEVI